MADIGVSTKQYVTTVELQRPPNNFLDAGWIADLATVYDKNYSFFQRLRHTDGEPRPWKVNGEGATTGTCCFLL